MLGLYLIGIIFLIIGMVVSARLKNRFKNYSKITISSGLSGKEVAEKMLHDHGIYDVTIKESTGFLSDHYNPANKTVNLSPDVYHNNSVAAAAVSAHECGHAVQHAQAYAWLQMRSTLVPVVQVASNLMQWVILAGILLINTFPHLLLFGIIMFGATTLFAFITLPVEFDASKRATAWLYNARIVSNEQLGKAKNALNWAASTYVVAALSSLASLLYLVMVYMGRRN